MPKVSVNLCCYNGEKYLHETLQSIFSQTFTDWELVVVNDGSTDLTEQIILEYREQGKPIVYHAQANAGLGRARNKALQLSSGGYVALIDQDDLWLPEKLESQVKILDANPDAGVVYSDCYYIDSDGGVLGTAFGRVPPPVTDPFRALLIGRNFAPCPTLVLRRNLMLAVGGFDPTLRYVEDLDLLLKMSMSHSMVFARQILSKYRFHGGNTGGAGTPGMVTELLHVLERTERNLKTTPMMLHWLLVFRKALLRMKLLYLHTREAFL